MFLFWRVVKENGTICVLQIEQAANKKLIKIGGIEKSLRFAAVAIGSHEDRFNDKPNSRDMVSEARRAHLASHAISFDY